jgi:hypothetical protein
MFNWLPQRPPILGHKMLFRSCDIRLPLRWPTKDGHRQFWLHTGGRQRTEEPLPCAILSYHCVFLQLENETPVPMWTCLHRINELLCYANRQSNSQIPTKISRVVRDTKVTAYVRVMSFNVLQKWLTLLKHKIWHRRIMWLPSSFTWQNGRRSYQHIPQEYHVV